MKKILITLTLTLFAASSYAQSSSVIVESGKSDSTLGKSDKIVEASKSDLKIIKDKSQEWSGKISDANRELGTIQGKLDDVISRLDSKNDIYMTSEEDTSAKSFTKSYVPTCYDETPRLVYKDSKWQCVEAVKCSDINKGQAGWIQDATSGRCLKPLAVWHTGDWEGCSAIGAKETRTVVCAEEGNKTKTYPEDVCTGPKPEDSRTCASAS
ncbi:MAG TPA: hypothetical protein DCL21_00415 [Alphaproteobacteria bacterium]|nr:hypothetical protein [Alphaproteobacteria bacterium]